MSVKRLLVLACALTALLALAPAANAAIRSTTIYYGPYTIPAGSGDPHNHDAMGAIANQIAFNVAKPCSGCTIIKVQPDMVYSDGTKANINTGPMLHHFFLSAQGGGKTDTTCNGTTVGQLGQRWFAAGNERTTIDVSSIPYGYKIGSSEQWNMVYDLMNWATTSKTVRIKVTYTYATSGDHTARTGVKPVWLDADGCSTDSLISVPNTGPTDHHRDWSANFNGKVVGAAGHIHDHGVNVQLTNESAGGANICNSVATIGGTPDYVTPDGRGHISNMTTCVGNPVATFNSGNTLRLHTNYNVPSTHEPLDDAMGIMILWAQQL